MNEVSTSWHSYPKIFALGHREIQDILKDPIVIEEKVDGSQISFGLFEDGLRVKSKSCDINIDDPVKMFKQAIEVIKTLDLRPGYTYRGEYLQKPKHNALNYDRTPLNHIMIFDINDGHESYLNVNQKYVEAKRLGLECVPFYLVDQDLSIENVHGFLSNISILGGQKIEGIVIKNYKRIGQDGKVMMGKFVSEEFKEVHRKEWKIANPTSKDIVFLISEKLRSPARWHKALIHLREKGLLLQAPQDIPNLMREVQEDIKIECLELIVKDLLAFALPSILKGCIKGLPEWYKEELLKLQFQEESKEEYDARMPV
jgi:RNA ligase